jgi:hypothetical protein
LFEDLSPHVLGVLLGQRRRAGAGPAEGDPELASEDTPDHAVGVVEEVFQVTLKFRLLRRLQQRRQKWVEWAWRS